MRTIRQSPSPEDGTTIGGVGVVAALLRGRETLRLGDMLLRVDLVEDAD
jgi:hypothetical protein